MNDAGNGYAFGGTRARLIAARLEYVKQHGAAFLFNNQKPPAPGWPRQPRVEENADVNFDRP